MHKAVELGGGVDAWTHVLFCDPKPHEWGAQPEATGRFKVVRSVTAELTHRVVEDGDQKRAEVAANEASLAVQKAVREFALKHDAYHKDIVRDLLEVDEFRDNYGRWIAAARSMKTRTHQPVAERLPKDPIVQKSARWIDRLTQQMAAGSARTPEERQFRIVCYTAPAFRDATNPFWFVYDQGFPADIADAMTGKIESEAAMLLLAFVSDWSAEDLRELSRFRERALLRYARFIAAIVDGVDMIAPSDRIDVPAIMARFEKGRKNLEDQLPRINAELNPQK
ncbi:MAG: hypothetical protein ABI591_09705 [Kofleriaceae bacterium]